MVKGTRCPAGSDPVKKWSESRAAAQKGRWDEGTEKPMSGITRVLQDICPFGPLPCSHSISPLDHSQQGIGYRWPCAILG